MPYAAVTYPHFQAGTDRMDLSQQDVAKSYSRSQGGWRRRARCWTVKLRFCRLNRAQRTKKLVVE
jgi:hypothetical protein